MAAPVVVNVSKKIYSGNGIRIVPKRHTTNANASLRENIFANAVVAVIELVHMVTTANKYHSF